MSLRAIIVALAASSAILGASAASASQVYSENFNAAGFVGSSLGLIGSEASSDRWANTDYFQINNFDGWTFTGGAYLAQQRGTSDGALLLNENGGMATTLIGLTAGQDYTFSLLLSGDNRPGLTYVFNATLDGVVHSISGVDGAAGSSAGSPYSFNFTATGASASLMLWQTSPGEASPIVDNISITQAAGAVPEPATWGLMMGGFGLAGAALRRRKTYRLVEIAADGTRASEEFKAADDQNALAQALFVAEGIAMELWRGDQLVQRRDTLRQTAA